MSKSSLTAILIIIIILLIGGAAYVLSRENTDANVSEVDATVVASPINDTPELSTPEADEMQSITLSMLAEHDSASDCWTAINGFVYDITSYIPRHPGGEEILQACGTDGTSLFTQRQTTEGENVGSGTPHSSTAARQLEQFKIGELSN